MNRNIVVRGGHDEKRSLQSTTKTAVVYDAVDQTALVDIYGLTCSEKEELYNAARLNSSKSTKKKL